MRNTKVLTLVLMFIPLVIRAGAGKKCQIIEVSL